MLHAFSQNKKHQIGLINLAIDGADSVKTIHQIEDNYISFIQEILDAMQDAPVEHKV